MSKKKDERIVYVKKLGGNPFKLFKQKSSLNAAIDTSEEGSILKLGATSFEVDKEEISIDFSLTLEGGKASYPSLIFKNMPRGVGIRCQYGSEVLLKRINIFATDNTIPVYIPPSFQGVLTLDDIKYDPPNFLKKYEMLAPILVYEGAGKLVIRNSYLPWLKIEAPLAEVLIVNSKIGNIDKSSFIHANHLEITNSTLDGISIKTEDQLDMYDVYIRNYVEIEGNSYIKNITFKPLKEASDTTSPYVYLKPHTKTTVDDILNDTLEKTAFYVNEGTLWLNLSKKIEGEGIKLSDATLNTTSEGLIKINTV